jgi:ribosomal protein S18 acetylase RimI-like enzyme
MILADLMLRPVVPSRSHMASWVILRCVVGIHLVVVTQALSASRLVSNRNRIDVRPVQSNSDLIALADLRYQEWMTEESCAETSRPSLTAFRMATAEIQQERIAQNAVVFLAICKSDDGIVAMNENGNGDAVVGTAELSSIEIEGCWGEDPAPCQCFYITDVVTARNHRRKGVAATLMMAMEEHAMALHQQHHQRISRDTNMQEPLVLLLHVDPSNVGALCFYESLGCKVYSSAVVESDLLNGLNLDRLSENAGVQGQILLFKSVKSRKPTRIRRQSQGKGFG